MGSAPSAVTMHEKMLQDALKSYNNSVRSCMGMEKRASEKEVRDCEFRVQLAAEYLKMEILSQLNIDHMAVSQNPRLMSDAARRITDYMNANQQLPNAIMSWLNELRHNLHTQQSALVIKSMTPDKTQLHKSFYKQMLMPQISESP